MQTQLGGTWGLATKETFLEPFGKQSPLAGHGFCWGPSGWVPGYSCLLSLSFLLCPVGWDPDYSGQPQRALVSMLGDQLSA